MRESDAPRLSHHLQDGKISIDQFEAVDSQVQKTFRSTAAPSYIPEHKYTEGYVGMWRRTLTVLTGGYARD